MRATFRRIIGYVPQMLSADGTLTGYENLLIFAKLYDLPRAERKPRVRGRWNSWASRRRRTGSSAPTPAA